MCLCKVPSVLNPEQHLETGPLLVLHQSSAMCYHLMSEAPRLLMSLIKVKNAPFSFSIFIIALHFVGFYLKFLI